MALSRGTNPDLETIAMDGVCLRQGKGQHNVTGTVQLFATPWTTACQASLSFSISQSLLKLMSIESGQI